MTGQIKHKPKISAIMVTFRTGASLKQAVETACQDDMIQELILVDNGSGQKGRQMISRLNQKYPKIRLVQGHGNVGFARGCNYGATLARGDYLVFINPDAVLTEGSVEKMQAFGKGLKAPWIIGGMLKDIHGQEQRGGRRRELTPLSAFTAFTGLSKLPMFQAVHMEREPVPSEPQSVPTISGAFMMMDRVSFNHVGGFDENFFLHVEDIDICKRVREKGGEVYFHPGVSVMHYGSTSHVPRLFVEWQKLKGFVYYFRKFSGRGVSRVLSYLAIPPMAVAIMGRAALLTLQQHFRRS